MRYCFIMRVTQSVECSVMYSYCCRKLLPAIVTVTRCCVLDQLLACTSCWHFLHGKPAQWFWYVSLPGVRSKREWMVGLEYMALIWYCHWISIRLWSLYRRVDMISKNGGTSTNRCNHHGEVSVSGISFWVLIQATSLHFSHSSIKQTYEEWFNRIL